MFDTTAFNVDTSVFTVRKPGLKPWQLTIIGVLMAVTLIYSSQAASMVTRSLVSLVVSTIIVLFLYLMQKFIYDEKTATEYQCLIFSGSMRANTLISIILNRDGSVYYLDNRYLTNSPDAKSNHNLDQILTTLGVPQPQQNTIYETMNAVKPLELTYTNGQQFKLGIYPIPRPEGFSRLV